MSRRVKGGIPEGFRDFGIARCTQKNQRTLAAPRRGCVTLSAPCSSGGVAAALATASRASGTRAGSVRINHHLGEFLMVQDAHDSPSLAHIAEPLRHLAVPIETLTLDPANARKHDQRNLDAINNRS